MFWLNRMNEIVVMNRFDLIRSNARNRLPSKVTFDFCDVYLENIPIVVIIPFKGAEIDTAAVQDFGRFLNQTVLRPVAILELRRHAYCWREESQTALLELPAVLCQAIVDQRDSEEAETKAPLNIYSGLLKPVETFWSRDIAERWLKEIIKLEQSRR